MFMQNNCFIPIFLNDTDLSKPLRRLSRKGGNLIFLLSHFFDDEMPNQVGHDDEWLCFVGVSL
jgi:hypothetical protein